MRHRRQLATVAVAIVLVTAGCAGIVSTAGEPSTGTAPAENANPGAVASPGEGDGEASRPSYERPSRTIHVAAAGQVETQPDQAVLRVAVAATGPNASAVRRRIAENVSRMRAALADMGIERSRITTTDYDIDRNRGYGPREEEAPPFRGRHAFTITLTRPDRAGEVIVTAVENGVTSVDDVRFTLSSEKRRDLRKEALADAMGNAREQATVVAESAGLSVAGVGSIRTANLDYHPVRYETAALGAGGGAPTSIEGGAVTVTATVEVTYNATG